MDDLTPYLLAEQAKSRGTLLLHKAPCEKCGCEYYYAKKSGTTNGCIWCMHLAGKTPKTITEAIEIKPDGTEIYQGKRCRNCGCTERLLRNAFGCKARACYSCSIESESEKMATTQIVRLKQAAKQATNKFIIKSIERSGTVDIAPKTVGEYFEIRALIADRDRFNKIEAANNTGRVWEIGHHFPASGGGSGYRGKTTSENLFLIQRDQNRSEQDTLPENWNIKQVVWVGDLYNTIGSREAGQLWQERMGWDVTSKADKAKQKATESVQNQQHYETMQTMTAELVEKLGAATLNEDEWQRMYGDIAGRIQRLQVKMGKLALKQGKAKQDLWTSEGGLIEEAFNGINARVRVIYNTMTMLMDAVNNKRMTMDEATYCRFLSSVSLVKRAMVFWASDILKNPKRDIQGFTHPLLSSISTGQTWGCKIGANGKHYLCGWVQREPDAEPEEIDVKAGRNAEYRLRSVVEWEAQERDRKAQVVQNITDAVNWLRTHLMQRDEVTAETPLSIPYDWADDEAGKLYLVEAERNISSKAQRQWQWLDGKRNELNSWHKSTSNQHLSASDIERQAKNHIAEILQRCTGVPMPYKPDEYEVKGKIIKRWQLEAARLNSDKAPWEW